MHNLISQENWASFDEISIRLLDHDTLMTPYLQHYFGEIYAKQSALHTTVETYNRVSSVYQKSTSILLLDANLTIEKAALPSELLTDLVSTSIPFGKLLIDYGIEAKAHDRVLFSDKSGPHYQLRNGRRHTIIEVKTGKQLCYVEELFAPDNILMSAHQHYLDKEDNDCQK